MESGSADIASRKVRLPAVYPGNDRTTENAQTRESPHRAGFLGTNYLIYGYLQIVGGAPSLWRTRLRSKFSLTGKFTGHLAKYWRPSLQKNILIASIGRTFKPMSEVRYCTGTGNLRRDIREFANPLQGKRYDAVRHLRRIYLPCRAARSSRRCWQVTPLTLLRASRAFGMGSPHSTQ